MQCVHVLRGHSKPVSQMRLARGRLYTAAGGAIRVWDTATLRMVDRIQTSLYIGGIRSLLVRAWKRTRGIKRSVRRGSGLGTVAAAVVAGRRACPQGSGPLGLSACVSAVPLLAAP